MVLKNTLLTPALHVICEKPFLNFVLDLVDIVGFPGSSAAREPACSAGVPGSIPRSVRSPAEGIGYPLQHSWASLLGSAGREPACSVGDLGSIPGLGRSPWRRERLPLQHSGLETSMDFILHGLAKSRTQLRDLHLNIVDSDTGFESFQFQI